MALAAPPSSLSLGHSHCHSCHGEGVYCSTSYGIINKFKKPPLDGRMVPRYAGIRNPFPGSTQFQWLSVGRDLCLWKVSVAADYSDSVPDSSNFMTNRGYHPLEELKVCKKNWETNLTSAEIARTAVEANSNALLVFPGTVHCEPHEQISWAEFQYVVDDYGDIYFEIFDDANILEDPAASSPVNALIGMDMPIYENRRMSGEYNISDSGSIDEIAFDDDYFEVVESEVSEIPFDWGMPNASTLIHPIYFAKCLTKVINMEYDRKMDHPSNGVSILGCLRPAFADEESYIRRLFSYADGDGYHSEWVWDLNPTPCGGVCCRITTRLCRQAQLSAISLQDFQDAEPDFLVHSTSAIVERFTEKGIRCDVALKALCKKKGLHVEGANLIGVDSLGMDVRIFVGSEMQTHRFPFKVRATSEVAAEKQIRQLLFPRSRRKKLSSHGSGLRDPASF
ncbi:hypothetical protein TIFTF001_032611 [Ficus carica]|uniref:Pentatricopeptide repeat (PPR) superfamily protein n=1 Tax=Ficus carica TaxID=3494 RepID=A0AA88DYV8_FICCA|nr:hypothetical protein TIFTF001_032611 [Ficus carica]